jgi:DNA-binding NarL/FixJ family response regulator
MARELRPDAAIIDVEMPAGGGLRATQEICDCSPATAVLILSSDESDAGVVTMLRAGAVSYFRKGLSGAELCDALNESIDAHAKLSGR